MDSCLPERPTPQCHACLRRHSPGEIAPGTRSLRTPIIDASTLLVDGVCQFKVNRETLGQAALGEGVARAWWVRREF